MYLFCNNKYCDDIIYFINTINYQFNLYLARKSYIHTQKIMFLISIHLLCSLMTQLYEKN